MKKEILNIAGKGERNIFVIGESNSSHSIQRELFLKNIKLLRDCHCIAVPKLRANKKKEFKEELDKKIIELGVNHILIFGEKALKFLYGGRLTGLGIATYRGNIIPDKKYGAFVCVLLDPVEVDSAFNQNLPSVANRDLQKVINHLDSPFPNISNPVDSITICLDYNKLIARLKGILNESLISYDYETTGLNPYIPGQRILSIGIATRTGAFSFPFQHYWNSEQQKELKDIWTKILLSKVLKVAHNINFENLWENILLGVEAQNIIWDTMVTAHILNARSYICGLKYQAFIRYGIEDYNKEAKKYIESDGDFNTMDKMPLDQLCIYNGIDALVGMWLYRDQRREVALRDLNKANDFFLEGIKTFLDAKMNGVRIDVDYYKEMKQEAIDELKIVNDKINNYPEIKKYEEIYDEEINFNSVRHLRILFYEMLKLIPLKTTKKGAPSVDAESLEKIDHPLAKLIVEKRKLLKIKDTYIGQILRENIDGYIHPSFLLHRVPTFRGSSAGPNFQNFPNHDPRAKRMIRGGIFPHPGHHFVELDYSSAEIKTAACVTGDPTLVKYVLDPTTDMHRDQAVNVFVCRNEDVSKPMRQATKNELVFPQVYKAWFGTCANMLWQSSQKLKLVDDASVLEHLKNAGITSFVQFKRHIKDVCNKFWKRFPVLRIWQNQMIVEYQNTGMLKTVTGFQCNSVLTENMCCNYPIQGPSFHCLLWSMIKLNTWLKKGNYKTKVLAQIHDSIVLSIPPEELRIVLPMARKIVTDEMKMANSWVRVPFKADLEIAPIDRPWSEKKLGNWSDYE